ncbi:MAG: IS1182 family transposase [Armatimonadia bacterium]|nr:IS1182 family transposase [Armatimonadia bacterium]
MMGRRPPQQSLYSADTQYLDFVGEDTFYGFLARHGRELFPDEEFAAIYCDGFGRPSKAPGMLAIALLLQAHDKASDAEATARAAYDMRWKVALGVEMDEKPFAKSTLQQFRAQLVIHDRARAIFERSLQLARETGLLKGRKSRLAVDSTQVLGRGAVEDTYNLIAHGIAKLCRALAAAEDAQMKVEDWAKERGLARYFGSSIKASRDVDWDDAEAKEAFLTELIADGERVLAMARQTRCSLEEGSEEDQRIAEAAELLTILLWQDVEPTERGYGIKRGTAKDRVPSVEDPEQRHGHKSHNRSFTGHKLQVAVDVDSQVITDVEVTPGNEPDGTSAAGLVERSEEALGAGLEDGEDVTVEQVIGDTAYGSAQVRKELEGREVIAPTVKGGRGAAIRKDEFEIDLENDTVTCPEGKTTEHYTWVTYRRSEDKSVKVKRFVFDKQVCRACPRHAECVSGKLRRGRTITLHPDEGILQQARVLEKTDYFRETYRERVVVEHRIGRLVALGMRQSRFMGRRKTQFQALMSAAVANFTLTMGSMGSEGGLYASLRRILRRCWPQDALRGFMRRMGMNQERVRWPAAA